MRLTRGADYGARGIVRLARMSGGAVVLVSEIAAAEGLPESYLAKIFQDCQRRDCAFPSGGQGVFHWLAPPTRLRSSR